MKNKKFYLIVLVLLFFLGPILQLNSFLLNNYENNRSMIIECTLPSSSSLICEWNRTWGGIYWEDGRGVAIDSLNNIYVTGYTDSYGPGYSNMFLLKYDNSGVKLWNRTWEGCNSGYAIAIDSLDNLYVIGYIDNYMTYYDIVLVKFDNSGVELWNRTWGGINEDFSYDIAIDSLDNVYIIGSTNSYGAGYNDMLLVKYNSSGAEQWYRTWGGTDWEDGRGVAIDSSDNIYVTGITESYGAGYNDMFLVKYNNAGIQLWNRTWGGIDYDWGEGLALDSSDNIYIIGNTMNFETSELEMALVKYDSSGVIQWNSTWSGVDDYEDYGFGITVDSLNEIYVGGFTERYGAENNDIFLVEFNSSGELQWYHTWLGSDDDIAFDLVVDSSDNIYLAGSTLSYGEGDSDMLLVKYIPDVYGPLITINKPLSNQIFGDIAPDYNISIIEPNLDSIWYTLDGGTTNYTINYFVGTIHQNAWETAPSGNLDLQFYAKDIAGNIGYSEVTIEKRESISGFPLLLLFISAIGMIIAIYLKKKYK